MKRPQLRHRPFLPALILAALVAFLWSTARAQGPANDAFVNAVVIPGNYGQANGTTVGATNEAGEPKDEYDNQYGGGIWYRWSSPDTFGRLTLSMEIFEGYYYDRHFLSVYQDSSGTIFDLILLKDFWVWAGHQIGSTTLNVAPNTTYYFRIAKHTNSSDPSPIQFTLNFSPIYRTGVAFTRAGTLRGARASVTARVYSPDNASSVRVFSSGKGRASSVRYNGNNGIVSFTHNRVGRAPKGRRAAGSRVLYTVVAYKAGQEAGRTSRVFTVR